MQVDVWLRVNVGCCVAFTGWEAGEGGCTWVVLTTYVAMSPGLRKGVWPLCVLLGSKGSSTPSTKTPWLIELPLSFFQALLGSNSASNWF